jgi:DNA repair protein RadD
MNGSFATSSDAACVGRPRCLGIFLNVEHAHAIAALREQGVDLEALGLTREDLQRRLLAARAERQTPEPTRLPVQPQAHRQTLRKRLDEQIRSPSGRICEALGHRPNGRRLAALGGTGAENNLGAVILVMNREVNQHIGIDSNERRDQSTDALEQAIQALEEIADQVQRRLGGALEVGRTLEAWRATCPTPSKINSVRSARPPRSR